MMKEIIKTIIFEEFSKLVENIEGDFVKNYQKKNSNFLLSQLDNQMIANMVFVSSFESKSGFALEACAKKIAILRYGKENVPTIVNPYNLKHSVNPNTVNGQVIISDINVNNGELRGKIAEFRASNVAAGRRSSGVTHESIKSLLKIAKNYKDGTIYNI